MRVIRTATLAVTFAAIVSGACRAAPRPRAASGSPLSVHWPALDGGEFAIDSLRGQIVVIHVFTTWSLAAGLEVEALTAADAEPDVTVIGLALDPEGYPLVAPWRRASDVHYLIALSDAATRSGAGPLGRISSVPTTIVLDRSGRVAVRVEQQLTPEQLHAAIAAAR
jgi:hypothetical protein